MQKDKLDEMFRLRRAFMNALSEKVPGSYPQEPIDLTNKKVQQHFRDLALHGVEEIFEALQHLRNAKSHRQTEIKTPIDVDEFTEEMVDAFNFFLTLLILMGVDSDNLYDSFVKKDNKIHQRLKNGY